MEKVKKVELLNNLIAQCYNSEKGYKNAAEEVEDEALRKLFKGNAQQRYDFGHEIKALIRNLDGKIERGDTIPGKLHRTWMDLRSALAENDEKVILEEVKRGEQVALAQYDTALKQFSEKSDAYRTLKDHRNRINNSIEQVDRLITQYETA